MGALCQARVPPEPLAEAAAEAFLPVEHREAPTRTAQEEHDEKAEIEDKDAGAQETQVVRRAVGNAMLAHESQTPGAADESMPDKHVLVRAWSHIPQRAECILYARMFEVRGCARMCVTRALALCGADRHAQLVDHPAARQRVRHHRRAQGRRRMGDALLAARRRACAAPHSACSGRQRAVWACGTCSQDSEIRVFGMLPKLTMLKDFCVQGNKVFICDGWDHDDFTCGCDEEVDGGTLIGVLRVHRTQLRTPTASSCLCVRRAQDLDQVDARGEQRQRLVARCTRFLAFSPCFACTHPEL